MVNERAFDIDRDAFYVSVYKGGSLYICAGAMKEICSDDKVKARYDEKKKILELIFGEGKRSGKPRKDTQGRTVKFPGLSDILGLKEGKYRCFVNKASNSIWFNYSEEKENVDYKQAWETMKVVLARRRDLFLYSKQQTQRIAGKEDALLIMQMELLEKMFIGVDFEEL